MNLSYDELLDIDRAHLWHPYTQMKDFEKDDLLFIKRAKGIFLYDKDEKTYYDTISSWWCIIHGHCHPKIKEAISKQLDVLDQIQFAATTHEGAILLAKKLVDITPKKLTRVFYSDDGSTACEVALKMSFQYWQNIGKKEKQKFISLHHGYHGDTIGTMAVGGTPGFHSPFKPLFYDSYHIPSPYCYRCPYKKSPERCGFLCLEPLESLLKDNSAQICALIIEPLIQAAGGMIVYPKEYLIRLADLLRKYNVHLIFDEVATGFGRTGSFFALEQVGVEPDFICLSKGLTAGCLPLAATLTTEEIYKAFYDDYEKGKTFFHGHTFTANPVSISCALASLEIFKEEDTLNRARPVIDMLQGEKYRFLDIDIVGDVRGIGMIAAFELVKDKEKKESFPSNMRLGWRVYKRGLKEGLILRPLGDVIYLLLPLVTTELDLSDILEKTYKVLKGVQEEVLNG